MPKSSGQKLKLLYLRDILLKRTDDNHGMTATEIIDALSEFNIKSERKSLYDDISSLQMYGLDIEKSNQIPQGIMSLQEILSLRSLNCLSMQFKVQNLLHAKKYGAYRKIEGLVSNFQGKELKRDVFITNRVKGLNEKYIMLSIHCKLRFPMTERSAFVYEVGYRAGCKYCKNRKA